MQMKIKIGLNILTLMVIAYLNVGYLYAELTKPLNWTDSDVLKRAQDIKSTNQVADREGVVLIDTVAQRLFLVRFNKIEKSYLISSSKFGLGNKSGSNQTPTGLHRVADKIGDNATLNSIFVSRKNTKKVLDLKKPYPKGDYILTRILWLEGTEEGVNKGEGVDSYQRFIYIHGTDEESKIGGPTSHGCIRMINKDVLNFFHRVHEGDFVYIRGLDG